MDISPAQEIQSERIQTASYDISRAIEDRLQSKLVQLVLDDINAWCQFLESESVGFRLDDAVLGRLHVFLKEVHKNLTNYIETSRKLHPRQLIHLSKGDHASTIAYQSREMFIENMTFFELEKLHYIGLFRMQRHNLLCVIEGLSDSRQSQDAMTQENQKLSNQIRLLQEQLQTLSNDHWVLRNQNLSLQQSLDRQEQEIENLKAHLLIELTSPSEPANQPSSAICIPPFDLDDDQIRDRYRSLIGKSEQLERHLDRLLLNQPLNPPIMKYQQIPMDLFPISSPSRFKQEITSVANEEIF
jgi:hypothetical protein